MPRPGTPVIPTGWADHHRPTIQASFTAVGQLRHPGGTSAAFDATTGSKSITPFPSYFAGLCSVELMSESERDLIAADQDVTVLTYRVVVAWDATGPVRVGDVWRTTGVDANGDPRLVGREMTVQAVESGSLVWQRNLICTDDLS